MKTRIRVLIVEDNPDDGELIVLELRRHGFEPEWERVDTEEEYLARLRPELDLVLSDFQMPQFNGLRALELLGERELELPFILISGTVGEETAVAAMKHGAADYLIKDRLARLGPSVAQALAQSRLRRERRKAEQDLRESEELNRTVLNSMRAHIAVLDRESNIVAVNEAWREFAEQCSTGRCNELLCIGVGANYLEMCRNSRDCDETVAAHEGIQAVLTGAQSSFSLEYACHAPNEPRWFWMSVTPLDTSAGGAVVAHTNITKRKVAEEARRESEERFRRYFELGLVGMAITSPTKGWLQVNDQLCELLGYERNELLKMSWAELTHPSDLAADVTKFERVLAGEMDGYSMEKRWVRKDGRVIDSIISVKCVRNAERAVDYFVAMIQDITKRKAAERALRESEANLAAAQRIAHLGSWNLELEEEKVSWSAEMFATFGRDSSAGAPSLAEFAEAIEREDLERFDLSFAQAAVDGYVHRAEFRFLHPDGGTRWIESVTEPVFEDDHLVRMVGTMQDITERKQAVQQIREQADLLDHAQDAILVQGFDDIIRFWNKGAERLYGWTEEEAIGRKVNELLFSDDTSFFEARRIVIEQGFWSGELRHLSKDGREIIIEGHWTLVRDGGKYPKSILAINTDVTEKKKLEAQFFRAQRMESIGTLAGGIAHDLNNVLGPMIMAVDLLKLRITDPRDLELLELMETSGHRGADMVKQVLHFARGIEGRRVLISPVLLVNELQRIARDTFPKSISIEVEAPEETWKIPGDRTQLHQVLLNLCINARDAMPEGGRLRIGVRNLQIDEHYATMHPEAHRGPYVVVEVSDTGTGMTPEVIEKIFEPFFTTKGIGKGTGLGLSTTLGIVKSHGGFVTVESKPGQGTTFRINLPAEVESLETQSETAAELPRGEGEIILIIDDEASIRSITGQTLEAFGYRVMTAADGAEGIAKYSQHANEIAVVLTDMMMPVMDGVAVIRVLMRLNPEVLIIAASGLTAKQAEAEAAGEGVKHFLPKPYSAETMLRTLRELLHPDAGENYNPSNE